MNELILPVLAGLRIFAKNPYNCPGTRLFQAGAILWTLFLLGRVIVGGFSAHMALTELSPLVPSDLNRSYPELEHAYSKGIRLFRANSRMPALAAVGFLSPVLVVDLHLLDSLKRTEASAVLAHELAHIRRKDSIVTACISSFASLIVFFVTIGWILYWAFLEHSFTLNLHRAVWMSTGLAIAICMVFFGVDRIARNRAEFACDLVACNVAGGKAVASALVKAAKAQRCQMKLGQSATIPFVNGQSLHQRVRRALQFSQDVPVETTRTITLIFIGMLLASIAYEGRLLRKIDNGAIVPHCAACNVLSREAHKLDRVGTSGIRNPGKVQMIRPLSQQPLVRPD